MRVGWPYATRVGRREQVRHGIRSAFGHRLRCRPWEGDTQGQTQLTRVPQKYQQMRALRIRASGARGDAKSFAIEGMSRIVNGHDFQGVIE